MEKFRPISEEVARAGIEQAANRVVQGETFRDFFLKQSFQEDENGHQKHPVEAELIARAFELMGGRGAHILDTVVTQEMVDRAGRTMLDELRKNNLLK